VAFRTLKKSSLNLKPLDREVGRFRRELTSKIRPLGIFRSHPVTNRVNTHVSRTGWEEEHTAPSQSEGPANRARNHIEVALEHGHVMCPLAGSIRGRSEGATLVKRPISTFTGKRVGAGAVALALFAAAAPAMAQNVPNTAYFGGSPTNIVVSVPVIATVGGSCGFAPGAAPSGTQDVGQLDNPTWTYDFPFTLQCTGPSRIAVVSSNGGLKKASLPTEPGYIGIAPYDVAVNVVRTGGTTAGNCTAANLEAASLAACGLRGTASPTVGMYVNTPSFGLSGSYVRVTALTYGTDILVAGSYSDTLTVTVSPAS
jgi:hypothetical protein